MRTVDLYMTAAISAAVAGAIARGLLSLRLKAPPRALMKTNVGGQQVPAAIGGPLALAALASMALVTVSGAAGWPPARPGRVGTATALAIVVLTVAGSWDDRRGDERPRGFAGHLGAARTGILTGGLVKVAAGALAGLIAGYVIEAGAATSWPRVVVTGALVALAANFVNLTDRAPGRASKVTLVLAAPPMVFGEPAWIVAAAPILGAVIACLPVDLGERAMLGDAGANPLGAVIGLGLAVSLPLSAALGCACVLLALNLASERWSFSRAIERTSWLRAADLWGRAKTPDRK